MLAAHPFAFSKGACPSSVTHYAESTHAQYKPLLSLLAVFVMAERTHLCCHVALQIVAFDFGCKNNILRRLASFGCKVTVVPANYPAQKVMELNPDGIFLSNGPVCPNLLQMSSGGSGTNICDNRATASQLCLITCTSGRLPTFHHVTLFLPSRISAENFESSDIKHIMMGFMKPLCRALQADSQHMLPYAGLCFVQCCYCYSHL